MGPFILLAHMGPDPPPNESPRSIHYVGFRDDRYWNAYRLFGDPRMIHHRWDRYAVGEVGPGDVVIFAEGDEAQTAARWPSADIDERMLCLIPSPNHLPRTQSLFA